MDVIKVYAYVGNVLTMVGIQAGLLVQGAGFNLSTQSDRTAARK